MKRPKCCKDRFVTGLWKGEVQTRTAGDWCQESEIRLLNIDPQLLIQRLSSNGRRWDFTEAVTTLRFCLSGKPAKGEPIQNKELWEEFVFWDGCQEKYEHQTHG